MLGHQGREGLGNHQLIPVLRQPALAEHPFDLLTLPFFQGPVIEIGRGAGNGNLALTVDLQELQPIRDELLLAVAVAAAVLQPMLQAEQHPRLGAQIPFVDQHRPLAEHGAITLQHQGKAGLQQRMARAHQLSPWALTHLFLLKADPLIACLHGYPKADLLVAIEQQRRHVGDLVAALLPLEHLATKPPERLDEEVMHVVGMDAAGHRPFHLLPEQLHLVDIHALLDQGPLIEQLPQVLLVHGPFDLQIHLELPFGLLVVAHGVHQQVPQ